MPEDDNNSPDLAKIARKSLILRAGAILVILFFGATIGLLFHLDGLFSNDEVLVEAGVGIDRTFFIGLIIALCIACSIAVVSLLKLSSKKRLEEEAMSGEKSLEQKLARVPGMLIAMTLLIGMNVFISDWNRSEMGWIGHRQEVRQERLEEKIDSLDDQIWELKKQIEDSNRPSD
ncbi:MAG: hypothetical protein V3V10_10710 [Planctomycetota bacterium]